MKGIMENLTKLNEILLSENVVENFSSEYNGNANFRTWLIGILPEVEKCRNCKQNNPWHIYDVLSHILHSVEEINRQSFGMSESERLELAFIMFLHDIAKPKCKFAKKDKNGKMIDHFYNHNKESAIIAKRVLPQFGFDKSEIAVMVKLIFKHDIFINVKDFKSNNPYFRFLTTELVIEEIEELNQVGDGYKLFDYLIKIARADALAQNPEMNPSSLKLLNKVESIYKKLPNPDNENE